jgi:hypothetical protein
MLFIKPSEQEISVKIFIAYAHPDQGLRKKLENHLSALKYSKKSGFGKIKRYWRARIGKTRLILTSMKQTSSCC